jgi:hypothetical protein
MLMPKLRAVFPSHCHAATYYSNLIYFIAEVADHPRLMVSASPLLLGGRVTRMCLDFRTERQAA